MEKQKEPIRLRRKQLANGNISLYLDIYYNGKRDYEFLKMYLVPEKTKADKERNRQTLQLANSVKAKRIIEMQNGVYGFSSAFKLDVNFIDYYSSLTEKRKKDDSKGNHGNWDSAMKHLLKYCKASTTFRDIDEDFCKGFKEYLETKARTKSGVPLSQNSQHSYFCKLKACITQAYEDKIIPENVCKKISPPKAGEAERDYLTVEEVKALSQAECRYPILKRAFLFSCLTGIRWSDINKMRWSEVQDFNGNIRIIFKQKKTKGQEYLDINPQAAALLGERGDNEERVFYGLKYSSYHNVALSQWCLRAGITKDITFHCGRHTFAVMMLNLGTDIYTVSKLLGHKELKTTQIYAKLLDKRKQEAVMLIPQILE